MVEHIIAHRVVLLEPSEYLKPLKGKAKIE